MTNGFSKYDTGIRNAVIGNFQTIEGRSDIGALWENFLIAERLKWALYHERYMGRFFWRTTQQQEIDYIEEYNGHLHAFEFKWNPKKTARIPLTFSNAYPATPSITITPENYAAFLTGTEGITDAA